LNTLIKYRGRIILYLIIVVNALLLSACADWDIFLDMAEDWAMEKSILNDNGKINYIDLGREITDDTIDGIVGGSKEAPLQTGSVVDEIRNADDLAQLGVETGNVTLIEKAIKLRPNDWTYTEMLSAVYLATGDPEVPDLYRQARRDSEILVRRSISNGMDCVTAYRNMYQHRVESLQQQLHVYQVNDELIIDEIGNAQEMLNHPEDNCP
jgi:hypothetical protein